jgi:uncharacterized protein (TIGR03437 family)
VGPTQLNAVLPSQIYGRDTTTIEVSTPSETIKETIMQVRSSQPHVFRSNVAGQGAIPVQAADLNEDGTLNSLAIPADPGSIV